jgi:fructose-specific component phosphotransferase system IIB-like protein
LVKFVLYGKLVKVFKEERALYNFKFFLTRAIAHPSDNSTMELQVMVRNSINQAHHRPCLNWI